MSPSVFSGRRQPATAATAPAWQTHSRALQKQNRSYTAARAVHEQRSMKELTSSELTMVNGGANGFVAGDSIAEDLAKELKWLSNAKKGEGSKKIIDRVPQDGGYLPLIISAGSNDPHNPNLADNLHAMRRRAGGGVVWIAPINETARATVQNVADSYGDKVLTFKPAADNVHPKTFGPMVRQIREWYP